MSIVQETRPDALTELHVRGDARDRDGNRSAAGMPTVEAIAKEAYAIFERRGGVHGNDLDDWLEAERRLQARLT